MYPQPNTGSNGLAIASLVLGIVSLVLVAAFSWMLWGSIAGLCVGIVGTILGVMGRKNDTGRTMATAGMILSIIGIAIGAICFISCFTYYITCLLYTSRCGIRDRLTRLDENNQVSPGVAQRWESNSTYTSFTFYLREDASWSDGTPVTASDFVYAFQRAVDPATGSTTNAPMFAIKNAKKIYEGTMEGKSS